MFRREFDDAGSRGLSKCISNSLHGLGLLAEHRKLEGMITAQPCLDKLMTIEEANTQQISSSLYGIGRLAAQHLQGMINAQGLLEKLITLETTGDQAISNSLYSMGLLAAAGHLQGIITAKPFVDKLITIKKIDAQAICNTIYALGLLVKAQKLADSGNWSPHISHLLSLLCAEPLLGVAAHQVLFGLAALAPATSCDVKYLQQLFQCVITASYFHQRELAKLINYFVIFKSDHLALDEQFQTLLSAITVPFKNYPESLQEQLKNNIAELSDVGNWQMALQSRLGLSQPPIVSLPSIPPSPATKQPEPLGSEPYRVSTTTVRQTFLHQPSVLQPLFVTQHSESQRVTPRAICPPPPPPRRIVTHPTCQSVVRAEHPKPADRVLVWERCRQHPVFKAIADRNLNRLEWLLGIRSPLRAHHTSSEASSSVRARLPHPVAQQTPANPAAQPELSMNNRATADRLAQQFFRTNPTALQQLIAESTYSYFASVLYACSQHMRYQLAINNALHPIILYLPITELTQMMQSLRDLALYRDHKSAKNSSTACTHQ